MINDPVLAVAIHAARRAGVGARRRRARPEAAARRTRRTTPTSSTNADTEAENAIDRHAARRVSRARDRRQGGGRDREPDRGRRRAGTNALQVDRRSDRRHRQFRARLPVLRGVDRAHPRQRGHARRGARSGPRRALHGDQGQGRAAQRHADPRRRPACASRRRWSAPCFRRAGARSMAAYLPVLERARRRSAPAFAAPAPARSTSPTSPRDASTASGR